MDLNNYLVEIDYTNWRGERALRKISPRMIFFGANEWHPEPQWLLVALDVEKGLNRHFAMAGIHDWKPLKSEGAAPLQEPRPSVSVDV